MYNFMRIPKKYFKEKTWIDWIIKVLMRTTHVSGWASWTHKLVLVRHFPLIKKSYIVIVIVMIFPLQFLVRECRRKTRLSSKTSPHHKCFLLVYLLDYLRLPLIRPFLLLVLCQKSDQKKKKSRKSRRTAIINCQNWIGDRKKIQHNIAGDQIAFFDLIYQIHETSLDATKSNQTRPPY